MITSIISFIWRARPGLLINHGPSWNTERLLGICLILAISISACQSDTPPDPTAGTPIPSQKTEAVFNSPISPVSPVSTPAPTITEVAPSEIEFEGCLLFTSNRSDDFEIYKMEQNTNNLQQLTNIPGLDIDPAWSPDGTQIVFASNREQEGFQIYIMDADGSNQQRLGPVQPGDNTQPTWSPDGRQIIFQSKRDTNANSQDDNLDLYIMDADGSNINFLSAHNADDSAPRWSPDGSRIAFLSERSGQDEVYLMAQDGSQFQQLTELAVLKSGLNWSPDGQYLIFEGSSDLYTVQPETKQVTKLISFKTFNIVTPAWAQNENTIIFSSDRTANWELYLLDKSNSNEYRLAQITDDPGVDRSPAWFPCNQ